MARLTLNRIGQKFGLLTVVARAPGHGPYGRAAWLCECKCGTSGLVISNTGIKKRKNCGCCRKHRVSRRKETLTQSRLKELIEFFHKQVSSHGAWPVRPTRKLVTGPVVRQ